MTDAQEKTGERERLDQERCEDEARRRWAERWLSPTRFSTYL